MTPIAAYYIFVANENERAATGGRRTELRRHRPSLLDRARAIAAGVRQDRSLARSA